MKKICLVALVICMSTAIVGCSISSNQQAERDQVDETNNEQNEQVNEKDDKNQNERVMVGLENLLKEQDHQLTVQQAGGNPYATSSEFTRLVLDILERGYKQENEMELLDHHVIFSFEGYKDILFNIEKKLFQFKDEEVIYTVTNWDSSQWDRYILKEMNGRISYDSFEKDILKQAVIMQNEDQSEEKAILYYNGDIRLKVGDEDVLVETETAGANAFSSIIPSHHYQTDLLQDGNEFLVGTIYQFTNKYGSTAALYNYRYDENGLTQTWSTEELSVSSKVVGLDGDNLVLKDEDTGLMREVALRESDVEEIGKIPNLKGASFYVNHVTSYKKENMDDDPEQELILSLIVWLDVAPFAFPYYQVYDLNEQGLKLKSSYFEGEKAD